MNLILMPLRVPRLASMKSWVGSCTLLPDGSFPQMIAIPLSTLALILFDLNGDVLASC